MMEFSISRSVLLDELSLMKGIIEIRTTVPILSNLLFTAEDGRLVITATDLELTVRTSCNAKVKEAGTGVVPAKKLFELVRLLPEGDIHFKIQENHWVEVVSERKKYRMVGMEWRGFPRVPSAPTQPVNISARVLSGLISRTSFAVSASESRFTLNAALLIVKPETLTMVSTDGSRLAVVEADWKTERLTADDHVLIPKKALAEVERLAASAAKDAQIEFSHDDNNLFFKIGSRLLISRMLTGKFFNYEAVLPKGNDKVVVLDRAELSDSVRRVAQLADQRSHVLRFAVGGEGVEVSASSPEYGEAKEVIVKEYKGDPIVIGFNSGYLLDFLSTALGGPISFEMKDPQSAGQMRPLADEEYRYRYIIMPMRVK